MYDPTWNYVVIALSWAVIVTLVALLLGGRFLGEEE